ncbi:HlyD family secretion protein [Vibrio vulnificus]|uniref:efflux RND transporter periplasmic adaptor subunit n=1 Tax=Vibrio vulnificus TaxID=672 RepID=UPI0010298524|nr:HlyD family secretion protein [Vibrio vulnificus]EGR7974485.1 HlyD family secretion protein [Vibrio vulnificus]ELS0750857.1 HlyD family secretion protein [Vibrio vulnificus]MCA3908197.1 HlyD family secretion protein [Vibrio vulnificus]MCU8110940.1 HlyD family secretion protein [Vibrio vulnificus]RZP87415.1 HlyD family secretion protein [Vibrio vulnificus]
MMKRYLITALLALAAGAASYSYYTHYQQNPWTRDGQVRADVVQITPRVTGDIVEIYVKDNQRVAKGDTLFVVDPKPYQVALLQAQATEEQAHAQFSKAKKELERAIGLESRSPGAVPMSALDNYNTALESAAANVSVAQAQVAQAKLNLSYTQVVAPTDGFITNLRHHLGAHVVANSPVVALIDEHSFWIEGFFKETDVAEVVPQQAARVVLLSQQNLVLEGVVESIGYGISKTDGSTGNALLPNVNPNFQWIRLAQRIPVKIKLNAIPDELQLRVGATASVQIHKS